MNMYLILFFIFLFTLFSSIISMLFLIAKKGDERKEFIIGKASYQTFCIIIGMLLINCFESFYKSFNGIQSNLINPFIYLSVISLVFLINLIIVNKRYGV